MPGSLVVINAIGSILDYGVIQPPPMAARLMITAGLIVMVGLAFALLDFSSPPSSSWRRSCRW